MERDRDREREREREQRADVTDPSTCDDAHTQ